MVVYLLSQNHINMGQTIVEEFSACGLIDNKRRNGSTAQRYKGSKAKRFFGEGKGGEGENS